MCLSNRAPSCGGAIATLQSPKPPHSAWTGQVLFTNEARSTSCRGDGRSGGSNNAQTTTTCLKCQWETPILSYSSSFNSTSTIDAVCRLRIHEFAHDPLGVHNTILHEVLLPGGKKEDEEEECVVRLEEELVLGVGGQGIIGRGVSIVIVGGAEEGGAGDDEKGRGRREGEIVGWGVIGWN